MKKRFFSLVALVMVVCMTACGSNFNAAEVTPTMPIEAVEPVIAENPKVDVMETIVPVSDTDIAEPVSDDNIETAEAVVEEPTGNSVTEIEVADETLLPNKTECNETVYTNTASNIRSNPNASATKVGTVPKNTELLRTGVLDNGWSEIQYNSSVCYISSKLVTTTSPASSAPESAQAVSNETANTAKSVVNNTDGQTKTFSDGTVFVSRGKTPGGRTVWYMSTDNGTWPDYIIQAYDATGITDDMSDYDKAVAINNYICKVVDWDTSTGEIEDKAAYSACLFYGKAICTGYSQAFLMLCTVAGVGADRAGGLANGVAHEWNYVLIGDTKYWVDVYSNDKFGTNDYLMKTTLFPGFVANY